MTDAKTRSGLLDSVLGIVLGAAAIGAVFTGGDPQDALVLGALSYLTTRKRP